MGCGRTHLVDEKQELNGLQLHREEAVEDCLAHLALDTCNAHEYNLGCVRRMRASAP